MSYDVQDKFKELECIKGKKRSSEAHPVYIFHLSKCGKSCWYNYVMKMSDVGLGAACEGDEVNHRRREGDNETGKRQQTLNVQQEEG